MSRIRNASYLAALAAIGVLSFVSMRWGAVALGVLAVAYLCQWMELVLKNQAEILRRLEEVERMQLQLQRMVPSALLTPLPRAAPDQRDREPAESHLPQ